MVEERPAQTRRAQRIGVRRTESKTVSYHCIPSGIAGSSAQRLQGESQIEIFKKSLEKKKKIEQNIEI